MLLKDLIRFSNQHRTLYCYMILSVWIFLLIAFLYKYVGNTNNYNTFGYVVNGNHLSSIQQSNDNNNNKKLKKYYDECSPIENITRKDDGGIVNGWKLQGVLLVIRHGDRGPISHIKDINKIHCVVDNDILLNRYKSFLINSSNPVGSDRLYWWKNVAFHGAMLLPSLNEKSCVFGKLTYKGVAQILHLGNILQQIYLKPLGLYLKRSSKTNMHSTPNSLLNSDEILVYSTHMSRTFQSAMAFLYAFLPQDKWLSLNIQDVYSMSFCFNDCTCGQIHILDQKLDILKLNLDKNSGVFQIMQWIKHTVLQQESRATGRDLDYISDAVLTLICHNAALPCRRSNKQTTPVSSLVDHQQNDEINIDQEDPSAIINDDARDIVNDDNENNSDNNNSNNNDELNDSCLEPSKINALLSYVNWRETYISKQPLSKHFSLLQAYGMIRNIVNNILKMISGDRPKFVLYSGHDRTLQYLTGALGINTNGNIAYASRLTFEIYRSNSQTYDYYFRVIYNGNDVTNQIDFCEGGKSLRVKKDNRGNKADLCPIENIIRFVHDDYFTLLNVTNYKDACTIMD